MNLKALLTILASIIYLFGANWWYKNNVSDCSSKAVSTTPAAVPAVEVKEPLMFKWSDATARTYDKWSVTKSGIVGGMNEDNILEITGKYFKGFRGT